MRTSLKWLPQFKKWKAKAETPEDARPTGNEASTDPNIDQQCETTVEKKSNYMSNVSLDCNESIKSQNDLVYNVVAVDPYADESRKQPSIRQRIWRISTKFAGFIGPGIMVAVAYMDPGNYSTDVNGGSQFEYKMLFVILLSTVIALYLQTLAIRLGSVTGRDLAQNCREHFHKYLTWFLWILSEAAILATDVAEVAGFAIAFKVLLNVPLIAGVFISIADVMLIMLFYGREMGILALRALEIVVTALLMVIVVCFCVILGKIPKANVGHVFHGYIPSSVLVSSTGIYAAAGILGATVMPHSLYLGSAQAIARVREHDMDNGYSPQQRGESIDDYKPSVYAIRSTVVYAVVELCAALLSVALFVNSAILIVAGDTLYNLPDDATADLFSLNGTLKQYLGNSVAKIFFVALLFSGLSAGVICTIAGQIVSEGHINWKTKPWLRRIVTRVVTVIPCVVVVAAMGQDGISSALNWSQVVLTITLPFLATPLVYLTSRSNVMKVSTSRYNKDGSEILAKSSDMDHSNSWISVAFGSIICLFLIVTNIYLLTEIGINGDA